MKSRINWFLHLRSIYYLRLNRMSTHKMQCEFAQYLKKGPTVGESNTWITQKTSLRNHCISLRRVMTEGLAKRSIMDVSAEAKKAAGDVSDEFQAEK